MSQPQPNRSPTFGLLLGVLVLACGEKPAPPTVESSAPAASNSTTGSASAAIPPPPPPDSTPKGEGATKIVKSSEKSTGCNPAEFELATYLLRGELTLAGRAGAKPNESEFAASWLVQLQGKAQIAFAGFDHKARRIGRDRGIGNAREHAPRLFATGDRWTVVWFDDEGLAYAHPVWDSNPSPEISHFTAIKSVDPKEITLSRADAGFLVSSPFGTSGDQVSLFRFSPAEGQKAKAVGVTKDAKGPHKPVVSPSASGFTLAWFEEGGAIVAVKLDATGTQVGVSAPVVAKGEGRDTLSLNMIPLGADSLLTWVEGDRVVGRLVDEAARAKGDVFVIGKGKHPQVVPDGDSIIVVWVGPDGGDADAVLAARVGPSGASSEAVRLNVKPAMDPPAVALGDGRLAFAWTEAMGPAVASKRAWLRIIDKGCVKP
jgi:hypothetical protein